jgi:hypothetical protein
MSCPTVTTIQATECIGNSLNTINANYQALRTGICDNQDQIDALRTLLFQLSSQPNTAPVTYTFNHYTSLTRTVETWASNGNDGSGQIYAIPGSGVGYSFSSGTVTNGTLVGTSTLEDFNIKAPYDCDLFISYRGNWNQDGPNTYSTSPVLFTINFEYSTNNGINWIRPNAFNSFTYGSAGPAAGTNPYYLVRYTPIQNGGGAAVGAMTTSLNKNQTIKFRPDWKVYPLNGEQNTTRVSKMAGIGSFEIAIQPKPLII